MLRITRAVSEVRTWALARGSWPCRRLDGGLALGFPGDICRGVEIGWAEFEVNFLARRCVLVWDDAAGSTRTFVVGEGEAGVLLGRERAAAAPAAAEAQA